VILQFNIVSQLKIICNHYFYGCCVSWFLDLKMVILFRDKMNGIPELSVDFHKQAFLHTLHFCVAGLGHIPLTDCTPKTTSTNQWNTEMTFFTFSLNPSIVQILHQFFPTISAISATADISICCSRTIASHHGIHMSTTSMFLRAGLGA